MQTSLYHTYCICFKFYNNLSRKIVIIILFFYISFHLKNQTTCISIQPSMDMQFYLSYTNREWIHDCCFVLFYCLSVIFNQSRLCYNEIMSNIHLPTFYGWRILLRIVDWHHFDLMDFVNIILSLLRTTPSHK